MTKAQPQTRGEEYERFGKNLAKFREEMGLSQYEISKCLGLSQSTYAGYETGSRKVPLSMIIKLSDFFNVEADVLIGIRTAPKGNATSNFNLKESEINLLSTYRKLNHEGKQKLFERADELLELGYVEKGDVLRQA